MPSFSFGGGGGASGLPGFDMQGSLMGGGGGGGGLNFGKGTSALGALAGGLQLGQSIASGDAMGSVSGALKLGSMIPGIGTAFAVASFGLDLIETFKSDPVAEQKAYNEAYDIQMQKMALTERNNQRKEAFNTALAMATNQIELNIEAGWDSWSSEQRRLNEVYGKAAFASQALLKQLVQVQGRAAAGERYGKSAARIASVETLGGYGRTRAQLVKQLTAETTATARRMRKTHRSLHIANERAIAAVTAPVMEYAPERPFTDFAPTPLETGLKIAGSAISSAMKGYELTPEGDTFFGFTKGAQRTG